MIASSLESMFLPRRDRTSGPGGCCQLGWGNFQLRGLSWQTLTSFLDDAPSQYLVYYQSEKF